MTPMWVERLTVEAQTRVRSLGCNDLEFAAHHYRVEPRTARCQRLPERCCFRAPVSRKRRAFSLMKPAASR